MKVSIITVCFNSASTIADALRSVDAQSYENIEHIIIDGGSNDNTMDIVRKERGRVSFSLSEPDKGIYDAMNKGIRQAKGNIIGILNSDDLYADQNVIADIVQQFTDTHCEGVYADLVYVDRNDPNKVVRYWKSGSYREGAFRKGWMPPHPTFFVRREVYEKFGSFTTELKSAADYEIMLRFIHKHRIQLRYLPRVIVKMRIGGKSNVTLLNRLRANREDKRAWTMNGLRPAPFTLIRKPLSKIKQFFRKK